jgi:alanine racemase
VATPIYEEPISDEALRPTHLTIDRDALRDNYAAIARHVRGVEVMPILKANAYGHGLIEVARVCEELGAPAVGVAYLEEGIHLRRAGLRLPILILGGIAATQIPLFLRHDLELTASSLDKLSAIDACAAELGVRARVHLKIDTGMERIGVHHYSADKLLEASLKVTHTDVVGIFTHFANAEERTPTLLQLERFLEVLRFYERRSMKTPIRHAASSGAIAGCAESHLDRVRPGVVFYGASPTLDPAMASALGVRPALSWTSEVVFFKVVRAGDPVSYGSTWSSPSDTRVITLPVGYGDGYPRALSSRAEVLVRGQRYPVVGRVCMDQLMVSIGQGTAYNGDVVTLIGRDGDEAVRVEDLARWAGTIPHEILTCINTRVPRVYVDGGRA